MRSRAWRMLEFRPWSDWRSPTQASRRISGIASIQRSPRMTVTNSGRDHDQPEHRRHRDRRDQPRDAEPGPRDARRILLDGRERREEHFGDRPGEAARRDEHQVVGERVGAERGRAEHLPDQEVVRVPVHVEEEARAEDVRAEAEHAAQAPVGEREARPPGREGEEEERRGDGGDELLSDDGPGAVAPGREHDPGDPRQDVPGHQKQLQPAEVHLARQERLLRRVERRHDERQRERGEERLHLRLVVERGDRPRGGDPEHGEEHADPDARPEDGRAVGLGELPPLDQRRAQREVGEHRHDRGEHDHHRREAVVGRDEQPGEDDRDDRPEELAEDLRDRLPEDAAQDAPPEGRSRAACHRYPGGRAAARTSRPGWSIAT